MRKCVQLALVVVATTACGPTVEEPIVELATCGSDGPVRLIESSPDVATFPFPWNGRLLVSDVGSPYDDAARAFRLWSVGLCGESPTLVSEDFFVYIVGDHLITCAPDGPEAGDILLVDPDGRAAPRRLFENVACELVVTEYGWVALDETRQELLIHRDPDDVSVVAEPLATGIVAHARWSIFYPGEDVGLLMQGPDTYAIDTLGQVVRIGIGLATGTTSVVATDAEWTWLSPDGGTLWWKEAASMLFDPAPVHVRALASGNDRVAYNGDRPYRIAWPYGLANLGGSDEPSLVDLRDGSVFELPPQASQLGSPLPGTPVLVWADLGEHWLVHAMDEPSRRLVELATVRKCAGYTYGTDALAIVEPQDCSGRAADLWSYPYDGAEPELLARDVGSNVAVVGDRIVWSSASKYADDVRTDNGDLFVTDGAGERVRLAEHARLHDWVIEGLDGDVIYSVYDDDRSGLWRTAIR